MPLYIDIRLASYAYMRAQPRSSFRTRFDHFAIDLLLWASTLPGNLFGGTHKVSSCQSLTLEPVLYFALIVGELPVWFRIRRIAPTLPIQEPFDETTYALEVLFGEFTIERALAIFSVQEFKLAAHCAVKD